MIRLPRYDMSLCCDFFDLTTECRLTKASQKTILKLIYNETSMLACAVW